MRFSAPKRKPPGGRPSRGAKQKGRRCPRKQDAAIGRSTLRVRGQLREPRASKEPRKRLTLEPQPLGRSHASGVKRSVCRGTAKGRGGAGQGRQPEKAHGAKRSSAFFQIAARFTLASTKAGARSGDAANTAFPLGFDRGGVRWVILSIIDFLLTIVLSMPRHRAMPSLVFLACRLKFYK